jgi:adenylate cyclase
LYVGAVAANVDIEGLGLLDGLDGQAREERAELIAWLLDQDFRVEQIRKAISVMLMPAGRLGRVSRLGGAHAGVNDCTGQ